MALSATLLVVVAGAWELAVGWHQPSTEDYRSRRLPAPVATVENAAGKEQMAYRSGDKLRKEQKTFQNPVKPLFLLAQQ